MVVAVPLGLGRPVPAAEVVPFRQHLHRVGVVVVRPPQDLGIAPLVRAVEVAVGTGLEEGVVDAVVLGEVDVGGVGELVAVVPLPARVVADDRFRSGGGGGVGDSLGAYSGS